MYSHTAGHLDGLIDSDEEHNIFILAKNYSTNTVLFLIPALSGLSLYSITLQHNYVCVIMEWQKIELLSKLHNAYLKFTAIKCKSIFKTVCQN